MDLELTDKRALVTGSSRGIGLAVARRLLGEGARVVITGRDAVRLERARAILEAEHGAGRVLSRRLETGSDDQVTALAATIEREWGGVDILVNSAARPGGLPDRVLDLTPRALHEELDIKLLGYLRVIRAVAPGMVERGWGRIVNISGLSARRATSAAASIRNVGVAALTKNLADELGAGGVNVTVVHPGRTITEGTPQLVAANAARDGISLEEAERRLDDGVSIGRVVTADEVAVVVTFLASPLSVAINGDAIAVGGGHLGGIHY